MSFPTHWFSFNKYQRNTWTICGSCAWFHPNLDAKVIWTIFAVTGPTDRLSATHPYHIDCRLPTPSPISRWHRNARGWRTGWWPWNRNVLQMLSTASVHLLQSVTFIVQPPSAIIKFRSRFTPPRYTCAGLYFVGADSVVVGRSSTIFRGHRHFESGLTEKRFAVPFSSSSSSFGPVSLSWHAVREFVSTNFIVIFTTVLLLL